MSLKLGMLQLKVLRTAQYILCSQLFPNQMEKESNRDLSKGLEVSIPSHSRGMDGLRQAPRLLSGYSKGQSDLLAAAARTHLRENSALSAPEWETPGSDVTLRPSAAACRGGQGAGHGLRAARALTRSWWQLMVDNACSVPAARRSPWPSSS